MTLAEEIGSVIFVVEYDNAKIKCPQKCIEL